MPRWAMGVLAPILWEKLAPHQKARLLVFLDPSEDPKASGYHVIQSKIAIGSGGWLGKGFTLGTQKRGSFLPEQHTDFIFSVWAEEHGFFMCLFLLTLYAALLFAALMTATFSRPRDTPLKCVMAASASSNCRMIRWQWCSSSVPAAVR